MDLYYLMDLSKSMEDDKEKLSALGDLLAETMQNITSNFRLEFTTNSWLSSVSDPDPVGSVSFKIFNFFVTFRPVSEFIINIVYKLQPCITFNRENPIHRIKSYLGSASVIWI